MINTSYVKFFTSYGMKKNNETKAEKSKLFDFNECYELPSFHTNQSMIKRSNISFAANVQQLSTFEKQLAAALKKLGDKDILIVGDEIKRAEAFVSRITGFVIDKVFFIKEKAVEGAFLFNKTPLKETFMTNLSKQPVLFDGQELRTFASKEIVGPAQINTNSVMFNILPNLTETPTPEITNGIKEWTLAEPKTKEATKIRAFLNNQHFKEILEKEAVANPSEITFASVGGQDAVIGQLKKSVVFPIKFPKAFKNRKLNRGTLMVGPPGTGKSLLARAVAGETKAHYIEIKASELETKWVGETEEHWRDVFEEARANQPCVIFIDEIDAVARRRTGTETARHDDKVTNQILALMSDLEKSNDQVFVMAATNKKELLDEAIIRSGRFGTHINVPPPNEQGCLDIFKIYTKDKPLESGFDAEKFAKRVHESGYTGADIDYIVSEAETAATERVGIFDKMDSGNFEDVELPDINLTKVDFENAISALEKQKEVEEVVKPEIGFHVRGSEPKEKLLKAA